MKESILLFFLFSVNLLFAQKIEILNKSGFQHDYVVKEFDYIEDMNDTARLKYIATLRFTGKMEHYTGNVIRLVVKFQTAARKLGADAFCLQSFTEKDSITTFIVKVYFAGSSFLKENAVKASKNNINLLGTWYAPKDSADFYLEGTKTIFNSNKPFVIQAALKTDYNIAVNKDKITNTTIRFKSQEKSRYFIIPASKESVATAKAMKNPANKGGAGLAEAAIFGGPIAVGVYFLASSGPNKVMEIPYRCGRIMSDILK